MGCDISREQALDPARNQSTVFGEVANLYERSRPSYPVQLFDWISTVSNIGNSALVVDVGCGTGKSSEWFVSNGHTVVGIEPDPRMAAIASAKLHESNRFTVATVEFQNWLGLTTPADLVISGQAWHWADPLTRFRSAHATLKNQGWLCVFWNQPDDHSDEIHRDIDKIYDLLLPSDMKKAFDSARLPGSKSAITAASPADEFDESRCFSSVEHFNFSWELEVTSRSHVENLLTQSTHRLLPSEHRSRLLDGITDVINSHGGSYIQTFNTHAYAAMRST